MKLFLCMSALFAVWSFFSIGTEADATELKPNPPRFRNVGVVFSADMAKEDRDAFLAGLEQVRLRHQKDYYEIVRKWRESAPAEPESKEQSEAEKAVKIAKRLSYASAHVFEREFYHNPWFLDLVNVQMVHTENDKPLLSGEPGSTDAPLWDLEHYLHLRTFAEGADALIVVASDEIAAVVNDMIRYGNFGSRRDDMVILFAGVSSFDESVRKPSNNGNAIEPAKAPYAFAIRHPVDPWPNTELALSVFPKTKKIVLLTSGERWNTERENAFLSKLGPGKTLKSIPIPEIPKRDVTEADIKEMKDNFIASVKAEIQPDTVIVTLSSAGRGLDPASWLPEDFDACPVFADTPPVQASAVGGFVRSMTDLGVQSAELLEQLSGDSLLQNKLPPAVPEDDVLCLNEAALKRYGLNASVFPDSALLVNTDLKQEPRIRVYRTWTKKRIFFLLAANAAVLFGLFVIALLSIRAARRNRRLTELIYGALPVRVLVTDRDGRIIAHHDQYGELEQKGEFLWKNIGEVPWLQGTGSVKLVHDVFDSGKTVVREMEIDGERRVVVLARTPSDVFGRPAVIAVSSVSPEEKKA